MSENFAAADKNKVAERSVNQKIIVMGASKVGKSAIIERFLSNTFTTKYTRTIHEMYNLTLNDFGIKLSLNIRDICGSHEFPGMLDVYLKSSEAFVLVFDINDENSFTEMEALRRQVIEKKGTDVPIVVVGNKIDVRENVKQFKADCNFVEVSAKENEGILNVFEELFSQAKIEIKLKPAIEKYRQSLAPVQIHKLYN